MKTFARTGVAAAAVTVLIVPLIALAIAKIGPPLDASSPTHSASTRASPTQAPPTFTRATARRWPATGLNFGAEYRRGMYFWEGQTGWMHNGYQDVGPGEGVAITFSIAADGYLTGPTAVTVAGHEGTYREMLLPGGVRRQVWLVAIDKRNVMIVLELQPYSTADEVAEAHAIIGSLQYEPSDSVVGFNLLFTLPAGWDSG